MRLSFQDSLRHSRFQGAAAAAFAFSIALPALAADPGKILLGQLERSDAIVVGRATEVSLGTADDSPVSIVRFAVSDKIRGEAGSEIDVIVPRTLIRQGGLLLETGSQEEPSLGPGDEALLFLTRYPGRDGAFSIASGDNGKFTVTTNAEGEKRADRYMLSRPVAGGVPLEGLVSQIRRELKIGAPAGSPAPPAGQPEAAAPASQGKPPGSAG